MSCGPNVRVANGDDGGTYIGGTSLTSGTFGPIQVIADCKFHTLTGNISGGLANATSGSAATVLAGTVIAGRFSAIQLHSGGVIAYNK
jgi:hypothetical protein